MVNKISDIVKPGVLYGKDVIKVLNYAKENDFAIPAVNITSSDTIHAALNAAKEVNSPIIIQLSHGGAAFFDGNNNNTNHKSSVIGAVTAAEYVHKLAKELNIPIIMHTDHCNKEKLPWLDGLIKEDMNYFKQYKKPLFSSHMIDLSAEDLKENIKISKKYLKKLSSMNMILEIEIGVTGGEEDGVDNTGINNKKLYTQPEDIAYAYKELKKISNNFTIAATFGNVHGVYKPGNVKLQPLILDNCQKFIQKTFKTKEKPLNLVFHGGSGSELQKIRSAIKYGVVKFNIDTDTQYAFTKGIRDYIIKYNDYLSKRVGNPQGDDLPNKKYYDPRKVLKSGEEEMIKQLKKTFKDLNCINKF